MSDDEEKKKEKEKGEEAAAGVPVEPVIAVTEPKVVEPVIDGGANQLVAYRPNLEVEGEIAIIEKILAMRSHQKEEVLEVMFYNLYLEIIILFLI